MKILILGKKSYLSEKLHRSFKNSELYSLDDKNLARLDFKNRIIIINSFYSTLNLEKLNKYEFFYKKSIYDLSKFLDLLSKKKVRKIIYTSSSSIYNSINENDLSDHRNRKIYASTKYAAENLIKNFCSTNRISFCILRLFNLYGEKEKFSIISKIISAYKNKNKTLTLINNGNSIRDFIHINDVIKIYKFSINKKENQIIDVGKGYGIKIKDIISGLGEHNFKIKNKNKIEENFSISKINYKFLSNGKIENFLSRSLNIKNKISFKKYYSTGKNYLQDFLDGSVVYGAGVAGQELYKKYKKQGIENIHSFVDDDIKKQKKKLFGKSILSFHDLKILSNKKIIKNIIIAIPSLDISKMDMLIKTLSSMSLNVTIVENDYFGQNKNLTLSDVNDKIISNLFGRKIKQKLIFSKKFYKKKILITGAGGSIGSELVAQLLANGANVIALDHSEFALYNLKKKLQLDFNTKKLKIILGSINDSKFLNSINKNNKIDMIFHAAAYKHVNILEHNIKLAVQNNIFGTENILNTFKNKKIQIIIISTDKAVRPSSILGFTKRISEIVAKKFAADKKNLSTIKIVRFGNVFGSQGSAVELFIEQLNLGLPITITNPKAKRFFMSLREACSLVIKVTSLARKGKIYILEMGKQIYITDIVYKLAEIKQIPQNKIKFKFIGLKKGEKLSEELSLKKDHLFTANRSIYIALEPTYKAQVVDKFLHNIKINFNSKNDNYLKKLMLKFLEKEIKI